jgi:hypothetical protein
MKNAADYPSIVSPLLASHVRRKQRRHPLPLRIAQPEQVASHTRLLLSNTESATDSNDNLFIEF